MGQATGKIYLLTSGDYSDYSINDVVASPVNFDGELKTLRQEFNAPEFGSMTYYTEVDAFKKRMIELGVMKETDSPYPPFEWFGEWLVKVKGWTRPDQDEYNWDKTE